MLSQHHLVVPVICPQLCHCKTNIYKLIKKVINRTNLCISIVLLFSEGCQRASSGLQAVT